MCWIEYIIGAGELIFVDMITLLFSPVFAPCVVSVYASVLLHGRCQRFLLPSLSLWLYWWHRRHLTDQPQHYKGQQDEVTMRYPVHIPAVDHHRMVTTLLLPLNHLINKINHSSSCWRGALFWPASVVVLDHCVGVTELLLWTITCATYSLHVSASLSAVWAWTLSECSPQTL